MALPTRNTMTNEIAEFDTFYNGGKGSGNFGHSGRPGEVGGSGKGYAGVGSSKADQIEKMVDKQAEIKRRIAEVEALHGTGEMSGEEAAERLADLRAGKLDQYDKKESKGKMSKDEARALLDEVADDVMGGDLSDFDESFEDLIKPVQGGNLSKAQVRQLMFYGKPELSKDKKSIYYATRYKLYETSTSPNKSAEDLKYERRMWREENEDD